MTVATPADRPLCVLCQKRVARPVSVKNGRFRYERFCHTCYDWSRKGQLQLYTGLVDTSRPVCQKCGMNRVCRVGYRDGQPTFRRFCTGCRIEMVPPDVYRRQRNKARAYKRQVNKPYRGYLKDRCEWCDFLPVHAAQLEIDHINGNHHDNRAENLQTLCANCHRLKTLQERGLIAVGQP